MTLREVPFRESHFIRDPEMRHDSPYEEGTEMVIFLIPEHLGIIFLTKCVRFFWASFA